MRRQNRQQYYKIAQAVVAQAPIYQAMSDEELQQQTHVLREQLAQGIELSQLLIPAFAVALEADRRVLGLEPYPNQVWGAVALFYNNVAEMKTGEGKTLTATMPMYLYGLTGPGNFLITSNTYLAMRDGEDIGRVYQWLGLTVAVGVTGSEFEDTVRDKEHIYQADIIYTTNSGLGFDYLFDNLAADQNDQYIKRLNFALIDEIDAVLLDMAQTPLIISGAPRVQSNLYLSSDRMVKSLDAKIDIERSDDMKKVWFTTTGLEHLQARLGIDNILGSESVHIYRHLLLALRANYLFINNRDYMIEGTQLMLLDKINGRKLPGTKLQAGLHQAIEAKEGLEISNETRAMASITYQNLFRMFNHLAGMTGTAKSDQREFLETYGLPVVEIPTHRPVIRVDHTDKVYATNEAKIYASLATVKAAHAIGRPVLIETGSVTMSELYSRILLREGLPHNLLNAMSVSKEAAIIALAGQKNALTVATSMAGRGTDIKLGPGVAELGGLLVIGTERMANERVDNQLRGRAGRQGDPGESIFYVSLEDKLVLENGGKRIARKRKRLLNHENAHFDVLEDGLARKAVTKAQKIQKNQEIQARFQTLQYDQVLRMQRDELYRTRNQVLAMQDYTALIDHTIKKTSMALAMEPHLDDKELSDFFYNNVSYDIQIPTQLIDAVQQQQKPKIYQALTDELRTAVATKLATISDAGQRLYYQRLVILKALDLMWIEQVDHLQQLKTVVASRSWAQHNPFYEYQREALASFATMRGAINQQIIRNLLLSDLAANEDGTIDVIFP